MINTIVIDDDTEVHLGAKGATNDDTIVIDDDSIVFDHQNIYKNHFVFLLYYFLFKNKIFINLQLSLFLLP